MVVVRKNHEVVVLECEACSAYFIAEYRTGEYFLAVVYLDLYVLEILFLECQSRGVHLHVEEPVRADARTNLGALRNIESRGKEGQKTN